MNDSAIKIPAERGYQNRKSGIELLKIIALLLIVISHTVQTLGTSNAFYGNNSYLIDLSAATQNPQHFLLILLWAAGALGNAMFFICSAWFMLDDDKVSTHKIIALLLEILAVSVIAAAIMLIVKKGHIAPVLLIKSVAPTTFSNNWYLTCYLLFYAAHPVLNMIIRSLPKHRLLLVSMVLSILYLGAGFVVRGLFFGTELMTWLAVYFALAYVKRHTPETALDLKKNIAALLLTLAAHFVLVLITDVIGLKFSLAKNTMLHWSSNCSPIIILTALAAFNIARTRTFKSRFINYLASLSLLIYIIHENILLRTYVRPAIFDSIHLRFGYDHILLWVIAVSAGVFVFSTAASMLAGVIIKKPAEKVSPAIVEAIKKVYRWISRGIMKLN